MTIGIPRAVDVDGHSFDRWVNHDDGCVYVGLWLNDHRAAVATL